ncbi:MAG: Mov34/MPN/PAD-1 family protein [Proteobacteria bacterium]|nr:Mov34/MPN/PAD-1 family protein [Pseudomonadota bacterium]
MSTEVERPWVRADLVVLTSVLEQVRAHAREGYPSEACGFLTGPVGEPFLLDGMTREVNEADKYHKLDPERFPRTSRTYFKINELRAGRAFDQGERSGRPIKVIYHSHCDAGAHFSREDAATFSSRGVLMWPCAFVVLSVVQGQISDLKLWVHQSGSDEFREASLTVREG